MLFTLLLLLLVLTPFLHVIFAETRVPCVVDLYQGESFHIPDIIGKKSPLISLLFTRHDDFVKLGG
ncbi:hypothetical protein CXB51_016131 [Gossypium anomalum]|uniref:Uncharacterized protein n=1 Tax=Gossypium anomalum TaxID=47600 RepID=A0A8J5Z255_9ROSI|nr:hypothetical protein CXB51_016131 [Gossypium anomalum]